jgi:hypothetical protein
MTQGESNPPAITIEKNPGDPKQLLKWAQKSPVAFATGLEVNQLTVSADLEVERVR